MPDQALNLYIGTVNNNGVASTGSPFVGRIYSFQIDKTGAADDRDFVPVCSSAGVGGLFDRLHNVFYPSSSATAFACQVPTVTFGGATATGATVLSNGMTATATTPAHSAGLVDVVVDNGLDQATLPAIWKDTGTSTSTDQTVGNIQSGYYYEDIYVYLDLSSNDLSFSVTPNGVAGTDYTVATVETNNSSGYRLIINTDSSTDNCLKPATAVSCSLANHKIGPVSGSLASPNKIDPNQWGASLATSFADSDKGKDLVWFAVPSDSPLKIKETTTPTTGDQTTITFGSKANYEVASGSYQPTVVFTALANAYPPN
jgi:hypothetical protein